MKTSLRRGLFPHWICSILGRAAVAVSALFCICHATQAQGNPTLAEALDAPGLVWTTSGASPWSGQTTVTKDGVDAAQSGPIGDMQSSVLQTTVTGPGRLTFWWKVSSEEFFDYLEFYIDGFWQADVSGEMNWQQMTFDIPAGQHVLKWVYAKDVSDWAGQDSGWVDQVSFAPSVAGPVITAHPTNQVAVLGGNAFFSVEAIGGPLTYQWLLDGGNIPHATNSTFTINGVELLDIGVYSVRVSNAIVSVVSQSATLLVNLPLPPLISTNLNSITITNGQFAFELEGQNGQMIVIESSANLVDWLPIATNFLGADATRFVDEQAAFFSNRFYRLITPRP